jgi:hypothetical protein
MVVLARMNWTGIPMLARDGLEWNAGACTDNKLDWYTCDCMDGLDWDGACMDALD